MASDPHLPFLRAIIAEPDIDALRLVYAEWLNEHGDTTPCSACANGQAPTYGPVQRSQCGNCGGQLVERGDIGNRQGGHNPKWCPRCLAMHLPEHNGYENCKRCCGSGRVCPEAERAEFIRVECELARLDGVLCHKPGAKLGDGCNDTECPRCRPEHTLNRRRHELIQHAMAWIPVRGGPGENVGVCDCRDDDRGAASLVHATYYFGRGFPDRVVCSWQWWARHCEDLLAGAPIRGVNRGTDEKPDWRGGGTVELTDPPYPTADWLRGESDSWWLCRWPGVRFVISAHLMDIRESNHPWPESWIPHLRWHETDGTAAHATPHRPGPDLTRRPLSAHTAPR
jgi:uncharacterized protein (TIGR02996 family)